MDQTEALQLLEVSEQATPEEIDKAARVQIGLYQRRIDGNLDSAIQAHYQGEIRKVQDARDLLFKLPRPEMTVPTGKRLFQAAESIERCPKCEKALPVGAKFCFECGAAMHPQAVPHQAPSVEATEELPPNTLPTMIPIPEGWFLRGSRAGEGPDNETPQRQIWLDDYSISQFVVTNEQYRAFVIRTGYRHPRLWGDARFNQPEQPVVGISHEDATVYCAWLSYATGRLFQLPSEAQWEKAARGNDARKYPWGDKRPSPRRAFYSYRKSQGKPAPAASYPKGVSPYGVVNMVGNVLEWCLDVYGKDYYAASSDRNPVNMGNAEPTAPGQARRQVSHTLRGSSWVGSCAPLTYRFITPLANFSNAGFRCVEVPQKADD